MGSNKVQYWAKSGPILDQKAHLGSRVIDMTYYLFMLANMGSLV